MGITYEVSGDGGFVYTTVTGEFTEEDVLRHEAALAADGRIQPGFGQLAEVTGDASLPPGDDGPSRTEALAARLAEIAGAHPDRFQGARYAIVIQGAKAFELAKLFETIYDGPASVIVFYNRDIAKTWLGCKRETGADGGAPQGRSG